MFKKLVAGVLLASVALTAIVPAASAAEGKGQIKSNKNAVDRVVGFSANNDGRLDTLIAAVTCEYFEGDVVELLATASPITIFAPTNYAFRKLGQGLGLGQAGVNASNVCSVDSLLGEGTLLDILSYHVFAGDKIWYKEAKAARGGSIEMFNGDLAAIGGSGNVVTWDGGTVKVKNIRSSNAIIHVVDEVGLPPPPVPAK
jgi:uncharacterized surface protein with fasciclin (FAS1) repeats